MRYYLRCLHLGFISWQPWQERQECPRISHENFRLLLFWKTLAPKFPILDWTLWYCIVSSIRQWQFSIALPLPALKLPNFLPLSCMLYDTERQVTQNQEHSSYIRQQLSRCVLGRTKDTLVSAVVHFGVNSIQNRKNNASKFTSSMRLSEEEKKTSSQGPRILQMRFSQWKQPHITSVPSPRPIKP
jgi:hypothetical protein